MKKCLLLILPCIICSKLYAQTFNGGITLTSQSQVDAFNYTAVTGSVRIEEGSPGAITNLDGLSELTSIGFSLEIFSNTALTNISGLSNLSNVGGNLMISGNSVLANVNGLSKIITVSTLWIINNPLLQNLDGLSSLATVNNYGEIKNNISLSNINGLSSLTTVTYTFDISGNSALTNLNGLVNFSHAGGNVSVVNNTSLANFCGLYTYLSNTTASASIYGNASNPTRQDILTGCQQWNGSITLSSQLQANGFNFHSITGNLTIHETTPGNITNLDGLSDLTSLGGNLSVQNNTALTSLCGLYYLFSNGGPTGTTTISGNAANPTGAQIIAGGACPTFVGDVIFSTQAQIDAFNYTAVTGYVMIQNSQGGITNLDGLSELASIGGDLTIEANPQLISISGFSHLTSVGGILAIINNVQLPDLTGLSGLQTVGKAMLILGNSALTNIDALSHLTSVQDVGILSNYALTNINGLIGLSSVQFIEITDNKALLNVNGLGNLETVTGVGFSGSGLKLDGNISLLNLDGLSKLTSIGTDLYLTNNTALQNIDGLSHLTRVGGGIYIGGHPFITNVDGLSHVQSFYPGASIGDLFITDNASLQNINGLVGIQTVFNLYIHNNRSLTSIDGLFHLNQAYSSLTITNDSALTNLDGLSNVFYIGDLLIRSNTALTGFCGLYQVLSINAVGGTFEITYNAANPTAAQIVAGGPCANIQPDFILTTQAEVDAFNYTDVPCNLIVRQEAGATITNLNGLSELTSVAGTLFIDDNPQLTDISGLSNLQTVGQDFYFLNNGSATLNGLSHLQSVDGIFSIRSNPSLQSVSGLSALSHVKSFEISTNVALQNLNGLSGITDVESIIVERNSILTDVNGLDHLNAARSLMSIRDNPALTNIDGLSALTYVGASSNTLFPALEISRNIALTNLDGLSHLAHVTGNLSIVDNTSLSRFCGLFLLLSTNGLGGSYQVLSNAVNPTIQQIIDGGDCSSEQNHCPTAAPISQTTPPNKPISFQLQGTDADNDPLTYAISQSPSHGTATTTAAGAATYTPAANYTGTDQFKYKASDGTCDAEATVTITIVTCPQGAGYWKLHPNLWPITSMTLGTITYSQSQLLTILNTAVGNGNSADASLLLAYQEIAAKLNIANGTPVATGVNDSLIAADVLIGSNTIPMKVKPNTSLGRKMTSLATFLQTYNSGMLTPGCGQLMTRAQIQIEPPLVHDYRLHQNQPNPFMSQSTIRYDLARPTHVQLKVYDALGRPIATLVDEFQSEGSKAVQFHANDLGAGIYYYRLVIGEAGRTITVGVRKMMLTK